MVTKKGVRGCFFLFKSMSYHQQIGISGVDFISSRVELKIIMYFGRRLHFSITSKIKSF